MPMTILVDAYSRDHLAFAEGTASPPLPNRETVPEPLAIHLDRALRRGYAITVMSPATFPPIPATAPSLLYGGGAPRREYRRADFLYEAIVLSASAS